MLPTRPMFQTFDKN